jgi:glutathione S-transferase
MSVPLLVIGNKLYSSWSMRPWLVMKAFGLPFIEKVIPLYQSDSKTEILMHTPSGKVPALVYDDAVVWESLAIIEYLAERHPDKAIWPRDAKARAHARSAAGEMHAGFQALRGACPMNLGKRFAPKDRGPEVAREIDRVTEIWRDARKHFGGAGSFLYGEFSAADAMFAPVVTRFDTYQVRVDPGTRAYMDAVLTSPAFLAWREAALKEPWSLAHYETGETPVEVFHHT